MAAARADLACGDNVVEVLLDVEDEADVVEGSRPGW